MEDSKEKLAVDSVCAWINASGQKDEAAEEIKIRKGPWTSEEDAKLIQTVAIQGAARWDALALSAGLRRTGKSCRLRWMNYLRPSLRRGDLTLQEQLLILQLHSRFGNRWSKIAEHLPGRTDNDIKNYWRTRVTKQARQLHLDVNSSTPFHHALTCRLMERISWDTIISTETTCSTDDHHLEQGRRNHSGPRVESESERSGPPPRDHCFSTATLNCPEEDVFGLTEQDYHLLHQLLYSTSPDHFP